jgi:hypothetical protein
MGAKFVSEACAVIEDAVAFAAKSGGDEIEVLVRMTSSVVSN